TEMAIQRLRALTQGHGTVAVYAGKVHQLLYLVPNMDMESRIQHFAVGLSDEPRKTSDIPWSKDIGGCGADSGKSRSSVRCECEDTNATDDAATGAAETVDECGNGRSGDVG